MNRYTLLIKGRDVAGAAHRACAIGPPLVVADDGRCLTLRVVSDIDVADKLNRWFCEGPMAPPYPDGSLLHWRGST